MKAYLFTAFAGILANGAPANEEVLGLVQASLNTSTFYRCKARQENDSMQLMPTKSLNIPY